MLGLLGLGPVREKPQTQAQRQLQVRLELVLGPQLQVRLELQVRLVRRELLEVRER